jgi:hypothetical protein
MQGQQLAENTLESQLQATRDKQLQTKELLLRKYEAAAQEASKLGDQQKALQHWQKIDSLLEEIHQYQVTYGLGTARQAAEARPGSPVARQSKVREDQYDAALAAAKDQNAKATMLRNQAAKEKNPSKRIPLLLQAQSAERYAKAIRDKATADYSNGVAPEIAPNPDVQRLVSLVLKQRHPGEKPNETLADLYNPHVQNDLRKRTDAAGVDFEDFKRAMEDSLVSQGGDLSAALNPPPPPPAGPPQRGLGLGGEAFLAGVIPMLGGNAFGVMPKPRMAQAGSSTLILLKKLRDMAAGNIY